MGSLSVAVAMSGGVDSSVAAALLKEAGHDVVGFTLKLWDVDDNHQDGRICCTKEMARDAGLVCGILGVPHYILDLRDEFKREVIDRFESDYIAGRTPNPCVHCNSRIKWGALWEKARALGLDRITTGHYARLAVGENGITRLIKGEDKAKDQSYFLWQIPPPMLSKTLLPLGELTKLEVRTIAHRLNLPVADRDESQEICFLGSDDYRNWLSTRRPELTDGSLAGDMVDREGVVLGRHSGFPFFTIGQRKGLGLGGGRKYYVTAIDPESRVVRLGDAADLECSEFLVGETNLLQEIPLDGSQPLEVKVRYRDAGVPARVWINDDGSLTIRTGKPVSAVTPGQSAVLYSGEEVVAGGIIQSAGIR